MPKDDQIKKIVKGSDYVNFRNDVMLVAKLAAFRGTTGDVETFNFKELAHYTKDMDNLYKTLYKSVYNKYSKTSAKDKPISFAEVTRVIKAPASSTKDILKVVVAYRKTILNA